MTSPTFIVTRADGNALQHHGVKGQKWGIRRYQNEDGSLTAEGQTKRQKALGTIERYGDSTQHRVRRALGGGLKAAGFTAGAGAATAAGTTLGAYLGAGGTLSALSVGGLGLVGAAGAAATAGLLIPAALGGIAISAIRSGVQKHRVKKAQDYLNTINVKG